MSDPAVNPTRWTLKDVGLTAIIGAVFGAVYSLAFVPLSGWVFDAVGGNRALESLINGIWMLGGFIAMAVVRKPGACLIGESIAAVVEVGIYACPLCAGVGWTGIAELGNENGEVMRTVVPNALIYSGVLQGMGGEMVFCVTRYVNWTLPVWLLAGVGCALFSWASGIYVTHSYIVYGSPMLYYILVSNLIGIPIAAGLGGWIVSEALHGRRIAAAQAG